MKHPQEEFGRDLASWLIANVDGCRPDPDSESCVLVPRNEQVDAELAKLELTPVQVSARADTSESYFRNVSGIDDLLRSYKSLRADFTFEQDIDNAMSHVHPYADEFLKQLFRAAHYHCKDEDAVLIAEWASQLDPYTAVKSIESLLNSKADMAMLKLARKNSWQVHFDHLAIRCGSQNNHDAERVVRNLVENHQYTVPQLQDQVFYQFPDGWNAYVLFKMLDNGQMIRLFIDQSDGTDKQQIIQHWNRVYGYTAHHLAIRATRPGPGNKEDKGEGYEAVSLVEIIEAMTATDIECMQPTGLYTRQLLEQVFTRPESNTGIPDTLTQEIARVASTLPRVLENGKLLELVSRRELPEFLKKRYFEMYGLAYNPADPHHSAPLYHYFLPAQAAHVIRTSVQTR